MPHDVQDFQRDVIQASREAPVLVDFWAEWCAPCRILGPVLEKLAAESQGRWRLAKVDTEAFPEEAAQYEVRGIPNVKLFIDGEPVHEFVGALPEGQVRAWLERALPSDAEREARTAVKEAEALLFSEPLRALQVLDGLRLPPDLSERASDVEFLARLLLKLDEPGSLRDTESGRNYLEGIRHLGAREFDEALGRFIAALRADRTLDDEGPRRACAAVFRLLGHDHPVVRKRRGEFAGALYV